MMIDKHRLRLPPTRDYGAGEFPPVAPSPSVEVRRRAARRARCPCDFHRAVLTG